MKNNSCLIERFFKKNKNGLFVFGMSYFVLEILCVLCTAGPVLIETIIPSFCLNQGPSTPANLMVRVIRCGYHVCSKQDPLSYFKGLKMRIFGFWQKERVSMTITLWVLFGFFCDEYFWCQV